MGLKEDRQQEEGKEVHPPFLCHRQRDWGHCRLSTVAGPGKPGFKDCWTSKAFSLQKEEQNHLGARAVLGIACHKARRGGFGMKMAFTYSTRWLLRASLWSWSRAFPLYVNNEGKLCLSRRISENSKLHTRSQPYYAFCEVIWK